MFKRTITKVALFFLVFQIISPFISFSPFVSSVQASSSCAVHIENSSWSFYYGGGGGNFGVFNKSGNDAGTTASTIPVGEVTITLENVNFDITNTPTNFTLSTVVHQTPNGNAEDGLYTHTFTNSAAIPGNNGNIQTNLTITTGKTDGPQTGTKGGVAISTLPANDVPDILASSSFCSSVGLSNGTTSTPSANILISEVVYDSSSDENEGEWIELYNPTSSAVSLSGWTLGEEAVGVEYTFTGGVTIAANSFLLVVNDTTTFNIDNPGITPDIDMQQTDAPNCVSDTECLRLNNTSGDSITLRDSSGTIIDFVAWEGLYGFNVDGDEGFSICRRNLQDTDTDAEWANNCDPTPGSGTFVTQFPGGVPIASLLWGKADSETYNQGDTVTVLNDRSGNDRDGTNSGTPSFDTSNTINFYPTISFDGSSDGFTFPTYSFPIEDKDYTMYSVFQTPLTQDAMTLQYVGRDFGSNNSLFTYINSDGTASDDFDNGVGNISTSPAGIIKANIPSIISFHYNSGNNEKNTYINAENVVTLGSVADHNASNSTTSDRGIGFNADSSSDYFLGNIAEVLIYDAELDSLSRQKIDSYLSLKYGITLDQTVVTDYINSSGAILWDATTNAHYTNYIVGVGQNNLSDLDQKVSKSIHSGSILTLATDNDFTSLNTDISRTSLDDGKFLVVGSNTGSITAHSGELDTGIYTDRIYREWKVQNTGNVGNVFLKFDGFDDSYTLLTDGDGDFAIGSTNHGNLTATGTISLMLDDGQYFTLARSISNLSPTDITLSGSGTIVENTATGSIIGTLTTTDADVSDTHSYSFVTGTGDTDNASFSLSGSTLTIKSSPDYETKTSYSVRIQTSDGNGGTFSKTFIITVLDLDEVPPVISLTGSGAITLEVGAMYIDAGATWNDNIDGTGNLVGTGSVNTSSTGSYTVSYDYTDTAGNVATQVTRIVNVVDTTAPVITLTGSGGVTVLKNGTYTDLGATWIDNLDGTGSLTASGTVNTSTTGIYILTYDYTDLSGNTATQVTRTVNVISGDIPVITLTGTGIITLEVGDSYTDAGATWSDTEDGTGTLVPTGGPVTTTATGSFVLNYNYTDLSGNPAIQVTRTVNVVDTTIPVITLSGSGSITQEALQSYTDAGATWFDNLDGTGSIVGSGTVNINIPAVYPIYFNFSDVSGNVATQVIRNIIIINPTCNPGRELVMGTGGVVSCSVCPEGRYNGVAGGSCIPAPVGYYVATEEATSAEACLPGTFTATAGSNSCTTCPSGYTSTTGATSCTDIETPVITLSDATIVTLEIGDSYTDAGATWTDNALGSMSGTLVATGGPVTTTGTGSFTLSYNYTDAAGNIATQVTRTVNVVDTTIPVITITGSGIVNVTKNTTYSDQGATWTDNLDGTGGLVGVGTVNTSSTGSYTVTYNYTDAAGNIATTVTRTVNVITGNIPVITLSGSMVVNVAIGETYSDSGASATDTEDGILTSSIVTTGLPISTTGTGSYTVNYNVTDSSGNAATQVSRTVNVLDITLPIVPTINLPSNFNPVTGTGEPGSTVTVYSSTGAVIGTGVVDSSGNFSVTPSPIPTTGPITITTTDTSGNTSTGATIPTESIFTGNIDTTAPSVISGTLTGSFSSNSATLSWQTDEPTSSEILYGIAITTNQTTGEQDVSPRVTSHSLTLSNLLSCTIYYYKTISRDASGNEFIDGIYNFKTTGCVGNAGVEAQETSDIVPDTLGGTPTLIESGTQAVQLTVPTGYNTSHSSCPVGAYFQLKKLEKDPIIAVLGQPFVNGTSVATYELSAYCNETTRVTSFDKPVSISMAYTDADVLPLGKNSLGIYRYNTTTSAWEVLQNCVNNTDTNTITCETTNFSTFGIFSSTNIASSSSSSSGGSRGGSGGGSRGYVSIVTPDSVSQTSTTDTQSPVTSEDLEDTQDIDNTPLSRVLSSFNGEIPYTLNDNFDSCAIVSDIKNPLYEYSTSGVFSDEDMATYKDEILKFAELGVVNGYADNTFGPQREISRTEFLKVILKSHCYEYDDQDTSTLIFQDVDTGLWQARVISKAQELGLINGDRDENGNPVFRPDGIISKAEALKITMRMSMIQAIEPVELGYTDIITDWHTPYVRTGQTLGLFDPEQDNSLFGPDSGVSREAMIHLIDRLVKLY